MSKMIVADLYKLARFNGTEFSKDNKVLNREGCVITEQWFNHINDNWKDNGKTYVKDEEGTAAYYEASEKQKESRVAEKELKNAAAGDVLANAIKSLVETGEKKKPGRPKQN